jgi:hypothetical protein
MIDVSQASLVLLGLSVVIGGALLVAGLGFGLFVGREYPPDAKKEEGPAEDPAVRAKRSAAYRLGALVLVGLAVLTILEFGIAATWGSAVILLLIALFKAGLIVNNYMHVSRLWSEEGHS